MIRVAIADDHHLVRQGIRALLEKADDIEVVGEAADGYEALELVERLMPDVLIMDLVMPHLDGFQTMQRVVAHSAGSTQVVVLSMHSDKLLVRRALRNGARGYLLKNSVVEELLLAVRAASRDEIYLSPAIAKSVLHEFLADRADSEQFDPFERLTPRELEVLQLITLGRTNTAMAQMMGISVRTVEKHRANLMSKLGVHDVASLIRLAVKYNLISE